MNFGALYSGGTPFKGVGGRIYANTYEGGRGANNRGIFSKSIAFAKVPQRETSDGWCRINAHWPQEGNEVLPTMVQTGPKHSFWRPISTTGRA